MYCNKCGQQLPEDSLFCNKCGAEQIQQSVENVKTDNIVVDVQPGSKAETASQEPHTSTQENKKTGYRPSKLFIVAALVIILVGLFFRYRTPFTTLLQGNVAESFLDVYGSTCQKMPAYYTNLNMYRQEDVNWLGYKGSLWLSLYDNGECYLSWTTSDMTPVFSALYIKSFGKPVEAGYNEETGDNVYMWYYKGGRLEIRQSANWSFSFDVVYSTF